MEKSDWQEKGRGHRSRLRDKFLERGISGFSDVEIIELLLSFGTPRSDCKQQAKDLLAKFGTFAGVLEASEGSLQEVKGVGPKNSFALHFVHAVASHYLKQRIRGRRYLHSPGEVVDYLLYSMRGLKVEVFTVIYLDASHGIIDSEVVAEGTVNVNTIYPREILKKAIQRHAAALVVAHNHPSGAIAPSPQDLRLTKTLFLLGSCMQIQLLDHIIIGDGTYSFADHGLMDEIKVKCGSVMAELNGK